jgi:putative component of toxin-antitoxin plasmid stabilization module
MLPLSMSKMIEFTEYLDSNGTSPFAKWFDALDAVAAAKVRAYMTRVELGNYSNVEPIGGGGLKSRLILGQGIECIFVKRGKYFCFYWAGAVRRGSKRPLMQRSLLGKYMIATGSKALEKRRGNNNVIN